MSTTTTGTTDQQVEPAMTGNIPAYWTGTFTFTDSSSRAPGVRLPWAANMSATGLTVRNSF